jgi:hypothetical protein
LITDHRLRKSLYVRLEPTGLSEMHSFVETQLMLLSAMAHAYNPNYSGSWDWEDQIQGQPGQKFMRPHLNQWLGMAVHAYHSSSLEDWGPGWPGCKVRPYLKNN